MNELIDMRAGSFRGRYLLLTVSSLALLSAGICNDEALADDDGTPTVWIEIGGQLERVDNRQERLVPSLIASGEGVGFQSPISVQSPPKYAYGFEGKAIFEPDDSNWMFLAAIRYGRTNGHKSSHRQKPAQPVVLELYPPIPSVFGDHITYNPEIPYHLNATGQNRDTHTILDFQSGRDFGLGLFGNASRSVLSFGVRFAQFTSQTEAQLSGVVSNHVPSKFLKYPKYHHRYAFDVELDHSFSGIGPSLALSGSSHLVGDQQSGLIAFDWGANAAVLFGRQKTIGSYRATNKLYSKGFVSGTGVYGLHTDYSRREIRRSRSVTIPNVGGFAGVSFQSDAAKVSFGYRADFFLGAMDGGIDARKTYDRNFYGPFATVSIGLGD